MFRRDRPTRSVAIVLVCKIVALLALWWLCFSPAHRPAVDAQAVGRQLGVAAAAALGRSTGVRMPLTEPRGI